MTGFNVRFEGQTKEIDQLNDAELDRFIWLMTIKGDDGWNWVKSLAKWIRDNVKKGNAPHCQLGGDN